MQKKYCQNSANYGGFTSIGTSFLAVFIGSLPSFSACIPAFLANACVVKWQQQTQKNRAFIQKTYQNLFLGHILVYFCTIVSDEAPQRVGVRVVFFPRNCSVSFFCAEGFRFAIFLGKADSRALVALSRILFPKQFTVGFSLRKKKTGRDMLLSALAAMCQPCVRLVRSLSALRVGLWFGFGRAFVSSVSALWSLLLCSVSASAFACCSCGHVEPTGLLSALERRPPFNACLLFRTFIQGFRYLYGLSAFCLRFPESGSLY